MVEVGISVSSAKELTSDIICMVTKVATDIYYAVKNLGYDMDTTSVEINLRQPIGYGRLRVDLAGQYFGVWDIARRTFVD